MVAFAYATDPTAVPADERRIVTCDVQTLAAAFQIAYLAGVNASHDDETYVFLRRSIRNMQRSLRRARPTPREGIEAGLDLMLCAVEKQIAARVV